MLKHTALFSAIALLAACGGGSGGSDNTNGSSDQVKIALVTTPVNGVFMKKTDGSWEKLGSDIKTLDIAKNTPVEIATWCINDQQNTAIFVDVLSAGADYTIDHSWYCEDKTANNSEVTFSSSNPDIDIVQARLTYVDGISPSSGWATLEGYTGERTFIATGYDETNDKAYFYKKSGLELKAGDSFTIDFLDTTLSQEVEMKTAPTGATGFDFNLDYTMSDETWELPLSIYMAEGSKYIEVPASFRVSGDYYRTNWQFGDDSSLDVYTSEPSLTQNLLTSAPEELDINDLNVSQDKTTISISFSIDNPELPLQSFSLEFDDFGNTDVGSDSMMRYFIDGALMEGGNLSINLVNPSDLPDSSLNYPHPKLDNAVYSTAEFGTKEIGKYYLRIESNDNFNN